MPQVKNEVARPERIVIVWTSYVLSMSAQHTDTLRQALGPHR